MRSIHLRDDARRRKSVDLVRTTAGKRLSGRRLPPERTPRGIDISVQGVSRGLFQNASRQMEFTRRARSLVATRCGQPNPPGFSGGRFVPSQPPLVGYRSGPRRLRSGGHILYPYDDPVPGRDLSSGADLVQPTPAVTQRAVELLERRPSRAADSLRTGCAVVWGAGAFRIRARGTRRSRLRCGTRDQAGEATVGGQAHPRGVVYNTPPDRMGGGGPRGRSRPLPARTIVSIAWTSTPTPPTSR